MIVFALGFAVLSAQTVPLNEYTVLGSTKVGDRTVEIRNPIQPGPFANLPAAEWNGHKYSATARWLVDAGSGDIKLGYDRYFASGHPVEWKTKVYLLSRSEILDRQSDGVLKTRKSTFENSNIQRIYDELALFQVMVMTLTEGKVKPVFDVTVDPDPLRFDYSGVVPTGWTESYLRPRVNLSPFDADDKVDRGPFHSVFLLHCGMNDWEDRVLGEPWHSVAALRDAYGAYNANLAQRLSQAWAADVAVWMRRSGYRLLTEPGILPTGPCGAADVTEIAPPSFWGTVGTLFKQTDDEWFATASADITSIAESYALPLTSTNDTIFAFSHKQEGGKTTWSVPLSKLDYFKSRFSDAQVTQRVDSPIGTYLSAVTSGGPDQLGLPMPPAPEAPRNTLHGAGPGAATYAFRIEESQTGDHGPQTTVIERGPMHLGSVVLLEFPDGKPLFDPPHLSGLKVWVQAQSATPFDIVIVGTTDSDTVSLWPEKATESAIGLEPSTLGQWQQLTIKIKNVTIGSAQRIELRTPRSREYTARTSLEASKITFAGWELVGNGPNAPAYTELTPSPDGSLVQSLSKMSDPISENQLPDLLSGLASRSEWVRLNAVHVLTRVKRPDLVAELSNQARSADAFIAKVAMEALAFQGGEEAWRGIRWCAETGPFDYNRTFAAQALAKSNNELMTVVASTLLTCPSWQAREQAVKSLAALPGEAPRKVMLAFLQESDPAVRLAVVKNADTTLDLSNRRLLWSAVNDPSEEVRLASYLKLYRSEIDDFKGEAAKAVRDESITLRTRFVRAVAEDAAALPLLYQAVVDLRASARANALRAMALNPGTIDPKAIQNVLQDRDFRVQAALIELAKSKGLPLGAEVKAFLKLSPDPVVRNGADSLP